MQILVLKSGCLVAEWLKFGKEHPEALDYVAVSAGKIYIPGFSQLQKRF